MRLLAAADLPVLLPMEYAVFELVADRTVWRTAMESNTGLDWLT